MKSIIFLLTLSLPYALKAQKSVTFDTTFSNTTSANFFRKNPVIDSVIYQTSPFGSSSVQVYSKTYWRETTYNRGGFRNSDYFNLSFEGDKYLFEKKYSYLPLPQKVIDNIVKRICFKNYDLSVVIKKDSIKCRLDYYCPSDEPANDEKIFTKIEVFSRYKNGIIQLQNQMQAAFKTIGKNLRVASLDSVLIYMILVDNKDSCLKSIELIEGRYSPFEQFVMDQLKRNCGWLPGEQGGRPVLSYTKIFIRLNKDGSITVAI